MSKQDGGHAFPRSKWWPTDGDPDHDGHEQGGMSLRDYFAAKAIGLFPMEHANVVALQAGVKPDGALVAKFCYELADAMLAERDK